MKLFKTKLLQQLFAEPISTRRELLEVLQTAAESDVFDKDSMPLLEAVLQFGDMRAKDILLPRHEVDVIDINSPIEEIMQLILATGHSRFPVIDENINDIVGIFHSKDIVKYFANSAEFNLHDLLRKPMFVPDMKPLDSLLYEMRLKHIHLAVVVDEFTNVAGIVTLEMIVEQIIGEIDDEHDSVDGEHAIVEVQPRVFRVKGYCGLEQFNNVTELNWDDEQVESVGGFITKFLGYVPATGKICQIDDHAIEITSADSKKINTLIINLADYYANNTK